MAVWILSNIKMLYCDRIGVSEGIDISKTISPKECDIFHRWYFLNHSFKFQPNVFNRYDLLIMTISLSDIAILNIKVSDYRCINSLISKNEAIKLLQNADMTEKREEL